MRDEFIELCRNEPTLLPVPEAQSDPPPPAVEEIMSMGTHDETGKNLKKKRKLEISELEEKMTEYVRVVSKQRLHQL